MINLFEKDFKDISKKYLPLLDEMKEHNKSEDNVAFHVIDPILIEELMFNKKWMSKQERSRYNSRQYDNHIDDKMGNKMIIEYKKANVQLIDTVLEDFSSYLLGYLFSAYSNWGILTNGYEWILIYKYIKDTKNITDNIILKVDLRSKQGLDTPDNLKYFSYNSLFKNGGITNYFRLIQQFRVYKGYKGRSWDQYKSALTMLSNFLIEKYNGEFVEMDKILEIDIINFFRWYASQHTYRRQKWNVIDGKLKQVTVENLYKYIKSFYKTLFDKGDFDINPLKNIKLDTIMYKLGDIIIKPSSHEFNIKKFQHDIKLVSDSLDTTREKYRNKVIISLFLYGLSREEIVNLKPKDYNGKSLIIQSKNIKRKLPLTPKIINQIEKYIQYKKDKKIKGTWLICQSTGKKITATSISDIINDTLRKCHSTLTVQDIQQYLIKQFISMNKDIFSLLYVTNLDLNTLGRFITNEDIEKIGNPNKFLLKNHPFKNLLM